MRKPIRILQFPGAMLFGGVGSVVMNLYRNIDKTKIQFVSQEIRVDLSMTK